MPVHSSVTLDRVEEAVRETVFGLANLGFCLACGEEAMGVEPDAEHYECEDCGESAVFGAEQCLIAGYYA